MQNYACILRFEPFQRGNRLWTSESDVYGRQILTIDVKNTQDGKVFIPLINVPANTAFFSYVKISPRVGCYVQRCIVEVYYIHFCRRSSPEQLMIVFFVFEKNSLVSWFIQ